ncbi:MAG: hypothetical protein ACPIOQ_62880, partial [Promethearchaeia archaeon]
MPTNASNEPRTLAAQVSPWALEWLPTDPDALAPPPPVISGPPSLTVTLEGEAVNDRSDYRAAYQIAQRRAQFLSKLGGAPEARGGAGGSRYRGRNRGVDRGRGDTRGWRGAWRDREISGGGGGGAGGGGSPEFK